MTSRVSCQAQLFYISMVSLMQQMGRLFSGYKGTDHPAHQAARSESRLSACFCCRTKQLLNDDFCSLMTSNGFLTCKREEESRVTCYLLWVCLKQISHVKALKSKCRIYDVSVDFKPELRPVVVMANNANYLSHPQCKAVNITCTFRHTSFFFFFSPLPLIFYLPEEMFSTYCMHQHTVLVVFLDVITKKPEDCTTAPLPVTLAWKLLGATTASVNRELY